MSTPQDSLGLVCEPEAAKSSDKTRLALKVVIGVWAAVIAVILIRGFLEPRRNTVYPIFSTAARDWIAGVDIYDYNIPRGGIDKFRYPPMVATWFLPLAAFPDSIGGTIWRMINVAVLLAGMVVFVRTIVSEFKEPDRKTAVLLAWLMLP